MKYTLKTIFSICYPLNSNMWLTPWKGILWLIFSYAVIHCVVLLLLRSTAHPCWDKMLKITMSHREDVTLKLRSSSSLVHGPKSMRLWAGYTTGTMTRGYDEETSHLTVLSKQKLRKWGRDPKPPLRTHFLWSSFVLEGSTSLKAHHFPLTIEVGNQAFEYGLWGHLGIEPYKTQKNRRAVFISN